MATIKLKGIGGGKARVKRVSRTWMIRVIQSQQRVINTLAQMLEAEKAASIDIHAHKPVYGELAPQATPGARALAPSGSSGSL